MRSYPSFTRDYVLFDLAMVEGWVWHAYAMENDGWLQFSGVKRKGDGYVAMETKRLMAMVKR